MFKLIPSGIPGCYEVQPRVKEDARGRFVKVFHCDVFRQMGFETDFAEEYYSLSRKGVVRGLHYQAPPVDHNKLVYCTQGKVFDVVLDLRIGSPTYGKTASFNLSFYQGNFVYIPKGLAHGFCATSDNAVLIYKVSTVYSPLNDQGVLWSSVGINWPMADPVISVRDSGFVPFSEFKSPFTYEE
jgi:dTDP-4-dehydrorhamnose 3,5-epimerase